MTFLVKDQTGSSDVNFTEISSTIFPSLVPVKVSNRLYVPAFVIPYYEVEKVIILDAFLISETGSNSLSLILKYI